MPSFHYIFFTSHYSGFLALFLTVIGRHMAICIPLLLAENVFCSALLSSLSVNCGCTE